jgi:hypothetical protein
LEEEERRVAEATRGRARNYLMNISSEIGQPVFVARATSIAERCVLRPNCKNKQKCACKLVVELRAGFSPHNELSQIGKFIL